MAAEVQSIVRSAEVMNGEACRSTVPRSPSGLRSTDATRQWALFALFVVAGLLALGIDVPLSRTMVQEHTLQCLHRVLEMIEPFGQPPAVISVSLAVLLCGGARRGAGFRIAAGALLSGLAVDVLKMCVARVRPRHFDFQGTVLDTFSSLWPGSAGGSQLQSWPSGHTATAVGFCLALSAVFPQGRWLFRALAALVAVQRIESGAHYLSDTLFAAGVACMVHILVFGTGPLGRWFDRAEARWVNGMDGS
jgi:membrane-associated phospholipid phosphatase